MADDPIRALLVRLPPSSFIPTEPGMVAIVRSRVVDAGADPEAVGRWVEDHGGYLDRTNPIPRRGLGPSYGQREPGEDFYAVPRDALTG
jgi:hypothetical protein